jgi:hypothetical protein
MKWVAFSPSPTFVIAGEKLHSLFCFYNYVGGDRESCSAELHNLYSSTNIINMIKSRRMHIAVHVARIG